MVIHNGPSAFINKREVLNMSQINEAGLFDADGTLLPQPAAFWNETSVNQRAIFGHRKGLYSFPTLEAVEFVKGCIAGREPWTLEVGAGAGQWCKALSIRGTDSFIQDEPEMRQRYEEMGQPTTPYGKHVEKLEAMKAVLRYRPRVVIGAWVTQKFHLDRITPTTTGAMHGVDEVRFLPLVDDYIFIGNTATHDGKMIFEDLAAGISTHYVAGHLKGTVFSRATQGTDFIIHLKRKDEEAKSNA